MLVLWLRTFKRIDFTFKQLKKVVKDIKLKDFKSKHIDDYIIWRRNNIFSTQSERVSNVTINRELAMISQFYYFCVDREYVSGTNPTKKKKLTNMRASGSDDAVKLAPPKVMTLEESMEWISDDELIEVTPKSVRLRKQFLKAVERKRKR